MATAKPKKAAAKKPAKKAAAKKPAVKKPAVKKAAAKKPAVKKAVAKRPAKKAAAKKPAAKKAAAKKRVVKKAVAKKPAAKKAAVKVARKVYHVTFAKAKKVWEVKLKGAKTPSASFIKKTDCEARGKILAKKPKFGQLVVHKQDGKIQTEYTYGSDPKRSKG